MEGEGDWAIARIAAAQCGLARVDQLIACGLTRRAISYRRQRGRLHPVFPSVLAVGNPQLGPLGLETAALLHAGDNCVLGHRRAAALWGYIEERAAGDAVDVTAIAGHVRTRPKLRVHRVAAIDLRDLRLHRGLPVTAPARTLIDFAADATPAELAHVLNEARLLHQVTTEEIEAAMARCPGRPGTRALRSAVAAEHGRGYTQSWLERQFRALVRDAQLPGPLYNQRVLGFRADVLWPRERVIVELDGAGAHLRPRSFHTDRRRDQILTAAGYLVLRVTGEQLRLERVAVAVRVAQTLAATRLRSGLP